MSRTLLGATSTRPVRHLIHIALALIALVSVLLVLGSIWIHRNEPAAWRNDWTCFYSAGSTFLKSGATASYARECLPGQFWLYPPYLLYPYAAGSLLRPLQFYVLVVAEILVASLASLSLLANALPQVRDFRSVALVVLASAPFVAMLATGQHSALLWLGLSGALWALASKREVLAGVFLGLMGIKPNLAAILVLWLIATRRWKTLAAMASCGLAFIGSTLPMGLEVWFEYLRAVPHSVNLLLNRDATFFYPPHKLITFEAFTRSTLGVLSPGLGRLSWLVLECWAGLICLWVWLRSRDVRQQLAITVLVAIAANVYVEFYDGVLLAVPAAIWWVDRDRYPRFLWRCEGWVLGGLWVWFWIWALAPRGPEWPSLVGGFLTVWIACEAFRILFGGRETVAPASLQEPLVGSKEDPPPIPG